MANLLIGCDVWITADGAKVGEVDGAIQHQGVNVTPDYGLGQQVIAWAKLCDDPSPPSVMQLTQPPPLPLAAPTFEPIYQGGEQVVLNGLANGARFTLSRNGVNQGTFRAWGGRFTVSGLTPPIASGDVFSATQMLCPADPPSPPGSGTAQPCSALPAPIVAPIQAGDTTVTLLSYVSGARIKVFNGSSIPPGATGFQLGVETTSGAQIWVDSDDVGGLPRPFDRLAEPPTKTMLQTLRFPASCFATRRRLPRVRALLLRLNRNDGRPLAFDDLEIVAA